jgi:hypothetical protein
MNSRQTIDTPLEVLECFAVLATALMLRAEIIPVISSKIETSFTLCARTNVVSDVAVHVRLRVRPRGPGLEWLALPPNRVRSSYVAPAGIKFEMLDNVTEDQFRLFSPYSSHVVYGYVNRDADDYNPNDPWKKIRFSVNVQDDVYHRHAAWFTSRDVW